MSARLPAPPRTRGWTLADAQVPETALGSPAHAGMDPEHGQNPLADGGLPRTRGDGPSHFHRDWRSQGGSPAHAGMDLAPPPRKAA